MTIYGWPLIETSPSLHWQLSNFSSIPHLICSPLDHLLKHLLQVCFGSSCQHLPTQSVDKNLLSICVGSSKDLSSLKTASHLFCFRSSSWKILLKHLLYRLICSALDHLLRRFSSVLLSTYHLICSDLLRVQNQPQLVHHCNNRVEQNATTQWSKMHTVQKSKMHTVEKNATTRWWKAKCNNTVEKWKMQFYNITDQTICASYCTRHKYKMPVQNRAKRGLRWRDAYTRTILRFGPYKDITSPLIRCHEESFFGGQRSLMTVVIISTGRLHVW